MATYTNITGISRAVMKDNAQETLANYDGNARPGELVVDLTQDPPLLYVGNNAGELTAITSVGGGLPLSNGTSNFDIAEADGNVTITVADSDTWTFDTDGTLTTPGDITVVGDITGKAAANTLVLKAQPDSNTRIQLNSIVDSTIQTHANLEIITDSSNTSATWTFDTTGTLTGSGNIVANIIGASTQLQGRTLATDTLGFVDLPDPQFGIRAFISDANLVAAGNFGAQVSGGGSNIVPIWCNGTNWYIG